MWAGPRAVVSERVARHRELVRQSGKKEQGHECRFHWTWAHGPRHGREFLKAGHQVTVYNRTPGKAEALFAQGARAAASIFEACQGHAVITMLANDDAVESVVLEMAASSPACWRARSMSPRAPSASPCPRSWKEPMRKRASVTSRRPCSDAPT